MRKFVITIGCLIATAAAVAGAALASPSQPVTISVQTVFSDPSDQFTTTGGVVCQTGSVSTPSVKFEGRNGTHTQLLVRKQFACPDGTFDLLLQVTGDNASGNDSGTWAVNGGTGAYKLLHGTGNIVGTSTGPNSIDDEYAGSMIG